MTIQVFPQLPGQGWPLTRSPMWQTGVQKTQSGRELRAGFMSYPLYKWAATYDVLRNSSSLLEFQQLIGFFNLCSGMATQFLFTDPDDNAGTALGFGLGDGSTRQFPMMKSFGGFAEPAGFVNGGASVYINGTLQSGSTYALNSPFWGWITFNTAPGSGLPLTWTGTYAYVCRFFADTYDFDRDFSTLYSAKKLEFVSVKP